MTEPNSGSERDTLAALPWLVMGAGTAFLAALAFQLDPPVQIAGDGALKQYLLERWADGGELTSRIEWVAPQPWVSGLWDAYHYPFEAPFVFEGKSVFPPLFLLLTFPLFKALGYAGLFVLPALSLIGLWFLVYGILRRTGASAASSTLALAAMILSPLTFFGMMFWEHTPGLFGFFCGVALLTRRQGGALPDAAGGFMLALAVMLRPELVIAAAVVTASSIVLHPRRLWSLAGLSGGIGIFLLLNLWMTGTPLGIHARQPLMLSEGPFVAGWLGYLTGLTRYFLSAGACTTVALLAGAAALRKGESDERRLAVLLSTVAGATLLLLPFMIPYDGTYLGFRRFELVFVPAGAILVGLMAGRDRRWFVLLIALCVLQAPRFVRQFEVFRWAHGDRIVPVVEVIRSEGAEAVVADSSFTAMELSSLMEEFPLVWGSPPGELVRLLEDVEQKGSVDRIALVFWNAGSATELTLPMPGSAPKIWRRHAGDDEGFSVFFRESTGATP